jgi:hypothetical protein
MKYTVYVKKEIKSEADLPKESGTYFVYAKKGKNRERLLELDINDLEYFADYWCIWVDWYLQPIELDDDREKCCTEFKQWQANQIEKRDALIDIYEKYINWLKTKPSKMDLSHAAYERGIELIKNQLK